MMATTVMYIQYTGQKKCDSNSKNREIQNFEQKSNSLKISGCAYRWGSIIPFPFWSQTFLGN
jgi:hypothetical protein